MEPLFESNDVYDVPGKSDRKNKIETQRRIRELKENYRMQKEWDTYYEYDEYDD